MVRNSLRYSRMFAVRRLLADLGGTLITATLLLYGLGAVIAASNLLVVGIQLAGACYVLIIGIRILRHAYWPSPYSLDTAQIDVELLEPRCMCSALRWWSGR